MTRPHELTFFHYTTSQISLYPIKYTKINQTKKGDYIALPKVVLLGRQRCLLIENDCDKDWSKCWGHIWPMGDGCEPNLGHSVNRLLKAFSTFDDEGRSFGIHRGALCNMVTLPRTPR